MNIFFISGYGELFFFNFIKFTEGCIYFVLILTNLYDWTEQYIQITSPAPHTKGRRDGLVVERWTPE